MIVFDENIHQQSLMKSVATWYRGQVVSITMLRPGTLIQDEVIPTLLQQANEATFVTNNVSDFWQKVLAHQNYCIICISLPNNRLYEISGLLRRLFLLPKFRTKAARMGKVVRASHQRVQYYQVNGNRLTTFEWQA